MIGSAEVTVEHVDRAPPEPKIGAPMYDYMVDIETTGTNPEVSGILQLSCVRFNRDTKEIDTKNMFDRAMFLPNGRYWSEDTREWWMGKADVIKPIIARSEDPGIVMQAFWNWVTDGDSIEEKTFWAKPITFDYNFVNSYFRQFGLMNPFHYREAMDLNSYIRGRGHRNIWKLWDTVPKEGLIPHNGLHDCIYQIDAVFRA